MKWRYSRAFFWGLVVGVIVFGTTHGRDGFKDLNHMLTYGRPGEVAGDLVGQLLAAPLLFMLVTLIHNLFVRTKPSKAGG